MIELSCNQCRNKFNIHDSSLLSMNAFKCPVCSNEISQKTFAKLISDYTEYNSYDDFTVRYVNVDNIDFTRIRDNATEAAKKVTEALFENLSLEDLDELLEPNNVLCTYLEHHSLYMLASYHRHIQRIFGKMGVRIGDLVIFK